MIVYKITNLLNGKIYIGKTERSLIERWREHCKPSSGCLGIQRAIQKYGKENFTVEQIDVACDEIELNKKEMYWIEFYNSTNKHKGYNLTFGGEGCACNEETRKKISKANTGKKLSDDTRKKLSVIFSKKWKNKDYVKHMRDVHKGQVVSIETRKKISETRKALGCKSPRSKTVICIETGEIFNSMKEASIKMNVSHSAICLACKGKGYYKTAGGYHWRYNNGGKR